MILSRAIEHMKNQHWTGAFIELVIVVLGVFIGLQVNNWNEARVDHVREHEYIERLTTDFEAIVARSKEAVGAWQAVVMASNRLRADIKEYRAKGALSRPMNEVKDDFSDIAGGRIPAPQAQTFVEMLSAGDVDLIRDANLRNVLLAYDSQAHYSLVAYEQLVSRTRTPLNVLSRFTEIDWPDTPRDTYLNVKDLIKTVDLAAFAKDAEAETAVKIIGSVGDNQRGLAVAQLRKAQVALDALRKAR